MTVKVDQPEAKKILRRFFGLNNEKAVVVSSHDEQDKIRFIIGGVPMGDDRWSVYVWSRGINWFDMNDYREMVTYPFRVLGCKVGICRIPEKNTRAFGLCRRIAERPTFNGRFWCFNITKESAYKGVGYVE